MDFNGIWKLILDSYGKGKWRQIQAITRGVGQ